MNKARIEENERLFNQARDELEATRLELLERADSHIQSDSDVPPVRTNAELLKLADFCQDIIDLASALAGRGGK